MPVDAHLKVEDDGTGEIRSLRVSDLGEGGTYDYAAGTTAGTVTVPATARLCRVAVVAGDSVGCTIVIGGGDTITLDAGEAFDETIPGVALGANVVIAGTVKHYYVAWVA